MDNLAEMIRNSVYSWDGTLIREEMVPYEPAEVVPEPQPTLEERNRADIDFIAAWTGAPL